MEGYFYGSSKEEEPMVDFIEDGLPVRIMDWDGNQDEEQYNTEAKNWRGIGPTRKAQSMGSEQAVRGRWGVVLPGPLG